MRFVQLWVISSIYLLIIREDHVVYYWRTVLPNCCHHDNLFVLMGQVTDTRVNKPFWLYTLFYQTDLVIFLNLNVARNVCGNLSFTSKNYTVAIATFSVTKTPALSVIDSYEIKRNEKEKIPIVFCPIPDHFLCLKTLVTFIPYWKHWSQRYILIMVALFYLSHRYITGQKSWRKWNHTEFRFARIDVTYRW